MAKFNVVMKDRRKKIQERKRAIYGDPKTRKLKQRTNPISISGKRKRKLFNKWRREQKEAIEKGLLTMEDVEMAIAEGSSQSTDKKPQMKIHLKKSSKIQIKRLKGKGKNKRKSSIPPAAEPVEPVDAMVE